MLLHRNFAILTVDVYDHDICVNRKHHGSDTDKMVYKFCPELGKSLSSLGAVNKNLNMERSTNEGRLSKQLIGRNVYRMLFVLVK